MEDDMNQAAAKPKRNWITFLLKLSFFITAFLLVIFTVLANMGGSGDDLKESVEAFFSDATGHKASIKKFNNLLFFPDIVIDFEDMEFRPFDAGENTSPVGAIGKMQASMSFWDVMFSTGKIKQLNLENVVMSAGAFFPSAIKIETARIFDEGNQDAVLEATGFWDSYPFALVAGMKSHGRAPSKTFRFGQDRMIQLSLGEMSLSARMETIPHEGFRFEDVRIAWQGADTLSGNLAVHNRGYRHFEISGTLTSGEFGSAFHPHMTLVLEHARPFIEGTVVIDPLYREDAAENARLRQLRDFLARIWNPAPSLTPEAGDDGYVHFTWDVAVSAPNVIEGNDRTGSVHANLRYERDEFHVDYAFEKESKPQDASVFSLVIDAKGISPEAWSQTAAGSLKANQTHDLWFDTPLSGWVPQADEIEKILRSCGRVEAAFSPGSISLDPDKACQ